MRTLGLIDHIVNIDLLGVILKRILSYLQTHVDWNMRIKGLFHGCDKAILALG